MFRAQGSSIQKQQPFRLEFCNPLLLYYITQLQIEPFSRRLSLLAKSRHAVDCPITNSP